MLPPRVIALIILALAACGIFLAECALFHFPFGTGIDVLWLTALTLLPGTLVVLILRQFFSLQLEVHEILALGIAVGFGFPPILLGILHALGIQHVQTVYYVIRISLTVTVLVLMLQRKLRLGFEGQLRAINDLLIFTIGALLFFAAYNLVQFHYGPDGSIVTRKLFGVDLPFLAGEIHGIQDFGSLRDLHQLAQPWHYHDWTYQLMALLPRARTLPDLSFAAPLVGYALLAFSIFALVRRLVQNSYIAYVSVALWFLVSGLGSGELGSYALSPSFVFGSIIVLNVLLALDLHIRAKSGAARWLFLALFFYFLLELSQTKLSTYLVTAGALGLLGVIMLWTQRKLGIELLVACALSLALVIWQNGGPNTLMPSGDFLVGAPLLGYANHIASILHVSVQSVNPVTHGFYLRWQSLLLIPYFVFHVLRLVVTDPKLLSAAIVLIIFRKRLWKGLPEITTVLSLLIPLGFLLPVLYSPTWYPLALSFYAPLVSVQAALLVVAVAFGCLANGKSSRAESTAIGLVGLLFIFGFVLEAGSVHREDTTKADIVTASFVETMTYLANHTGDSDIVATRRYDLDSTGDESFYWYSALSGRTVVSEGAKYGSLLAAVADTNTEKGLHPILAAQKLLENRRALLDTIYRSHDTSQVNAAIARAHISYIFEDLARDSAFSGAYLKLSSHIFFERGGYRILKVR